MISDTTLSPDGAAVGKALHTLPNWLSIRSRLVMLPDPGTVVDSLTHHKVGQEPPDIDSAQAKDTTRTTDSTRTADTAKAKKRQAAPAKKVRTLANGFVPQPLLWNNVLAGSGRWTPVDPTLVPALLLIVLRLKSVNPPRTDAARAFLAFLQGPRARSILRSNGFLPPP
mgnify:CR=1 FL=1